MGSKYTVLAWGQFTEDSERYSMREVWHGQSLLTALYALWKSSKNFGCVTLEVRG